jgi:hypothetical protein
LQINTVKYDADQEITNTYENLQIREIYKSLFFTDKPILVENSVYFEYLLVYWCLDLTSSINGKYIFDPSRIFGKFELTFGIEI